MIHIESITDIESLDNVAKNLAVLIPGNRDLQIHFPGTVKRYTGSFDKVAENLRETASMCEPGKREQFIAFWGKTAVGMSIVTNQVEAPEGIDNDWPNLSGFVLKPYRNMGIGRLAMEHRINVVNENFGGHAWTYVRQGNMPAEKIVIGAGFTKTDITVPDQPYQNVYTYEA